MNFIITTFDKIEIGQSFCSYSDYQSYVKISDNFAENIYFGLAQFSPYEKVYIWG